MPSGLPYWDSPTAGDYAMAAASRNGDRINQLDHKMNQIMATVERIIARDQEITDAINEIAQWINEREENG